MAKQNPEIELYSYGIYETWKRETKEIPKLLQITDKIPAIVDTEFGIVVKLRKAKGSTISFTIEHPKIHDKAGRAMNPFTGQMFVNSNSYTFFVGDAIWAPEVDKMGAWKIIVYLDKKEIVRKMLFVVSVFVEK